jgi:hypothetical protein
MPMGATSLEMLMALDDTGIGGLVTRVGGWWLVAGGDWSLMAGN